MLFPRNILSQYAGRGGMFAGRSGPFAGSGAAPVLVDFRAPNPAIAHPISAAGTTVTVSDGKTTLACTNLATSMALTWDAQFSFSSGDLVTVEMGFPVPIANKAVRLILATDDLSFTFVNYAQVYLVTGGVQPNKRQCFTFKKTDFTVAGAFDWANVKHVEIFVDNLTAVANATDSVEVYRVWTRGARPAVVLSFDDGVESQYTEAYLGTNNGGVGLPDYGMKASLYFSGSAIGTVGFMTLAQVQALYAAGWDVGNQGYTEAPFSQQVAIAWAAGVATVTAGSAHGFSNGNDVPLEGADPIELNGSKTIGGVTPTTFTYATTLAGSGNALGYISIPQGVLATHLTNATDHTAWQIANGMPRGQEHYAYSQGAHYDAAVSGLQGLGFVTGRTTRRLNDATTPATIQEALLDFADARSGQMDFMRLWCIELNPNVTVAKALATLQFALDRGYSVHIYTHNLTTVPSTSVDYSVSDYFDIIDAIANARDAGSVDVLTISEWYDIMGRG